MESSEWEELRRKRDTIRSFTTFQVEQWLFYLKSFYRHRTHFAKVAFLRKQKRNHWANYDFYIIFKDYERIIGDYGGFELPLTIRLTPSDPDEPRPMISKIAYPSAIGTEVASSIAREHWAWSWANCGEVFGNSVAVSWISSWSSLVIT